MHFSSPYNNQVQNFRRFPYNSSAISESLSHTHTCTHAHTHKHLRAHTNTCAHVHTHKHLRVHAHTHTYTFAGTHTYTCVPALTQARARARVRVHTHSSIRKWFSDWDLQSRWSVVENLGLDFFIIWLFRPQSECKLFNFASIFDQSIRLQDSWVLLLNKCLYF